MVKSKIMLQALKMDAPHLNDKHAPSRILQKSAATAISASAAAFRRRRRPSTEHLRRGALTPPDFKEEAIEMAYDLHGIDPGRLYATYFAGDRGQVVEADEKARGRWLKHLPEDVIIGCPARDNF
jgi:hypothetical protein